MLHLGARLRHRQLASQTLSGWPTDRIRPEREGQPNGDLQRERGRGADAGPADTSATILNHTPGRAPTVTPPRDRVVTADGHDWRNVQTSAGPAGWVAGEFLDQVQDRGPERYSVTADGVQMRAQPDTSAAILVNNLGLGAIVTTLSDQVVTAGGRDWRNVQTSAGQAGWVAGEFLGEVGRAGTFAAQGIARVLGAPLLTVAANWPLLDAATPVRQPT
jgi:SH3-like domain-containing protein